MKKSILLILSIILITTNCIFAVSADYNLPNIYLSSEYDEIFPFVDKYAIIKRNGLYGLIDSDNNIVINCEYDFIYNITDEIYSFKKYTNDIEEVLFSISNKKIINIEYEHISSIVNDMIVATNYQKYGVLNIYGDKIIPFEYEDIIILNDSLFLLFDGSVWYRYDLSTQRTTKLDNSIDEIVSNNGITLYMDYETSLDAGLINSNGDIITNNTDYWQFKNINSLLGIYIGYRHGFNSLRDLVIDVIDDNGNILTSFTGVEIYDCDDRGVFATIDWNGNICYYNLNGEKVLDVKEPHIGNHATEITNFSYGYAVVRLNTDDGGFVYINTQGKHINDMIYDIATPFVDGYALVGYWINDNECKYLLLDTNFDTVIDFNALGWEPLVYQLEDFQNGIIRIRSKNKLGFIKSSDIQKTYYQSYTLAYKLLDGEPILPEIPTKENTIIELSDFNWLFDDNKVVSYSDGKIIYYPGDDFTMPNHDVVLTAILEEDTNPDVPDEPTPTKPDTSITDWSPIINDIINNRPTSNDKNKPDSKPADTYTCPYVDIAGHWAEGIIKFIDELGLIDGITETEFKPDEPMTREMFVTAIARLCGVEQDYVTWAIDNGILLGYGNGEYGLSDTVTREQMAVFFVRFFDKMNIDTTELKTIEYHPFADDDIIADWSSDAVYEIQSIGLIKGKENNIFDPKGTATRAEAATVLYNLIQAVIEPAK